MPGVHLLDLPDSILFNISYHACLDDTFRLGLSCSRLYHLFGEPYWRWRAQHTDLEFKAHPSAMIQFFGPLKGFCRHCSSPLLYSWEETKAHGIPLWLGRIHNVFPDAVLHPILGRYFCHKCINREEYHLVHESGLANLGLSMRDMQDAPYRLRPEGLYFSLDVVDRKRRQKMDWLNACMKQFTTAQGIGPGTTLAPAMTTAHWKQAPAPHHHLPALPLPQQPWNAAIAPPHSSAQDVFNAMTNGHHGPGPQPQPEEDLPPPSQLLQIEYPSIDRGVTPLGPASSQQRLSSKSVAGMSPPHSAMSCDASATLTPLTDHTDSRQGSHLEGEGEGDAQHEYSPEVRAIARAANKQEAKRVREAQDAIMRAVKRDQLEEVLHSKGVLLTAARELEPEAQMWINSQWLMMKEEALYEVEDVAEALCQKWSNVLDWEWQSSGGRRASASAAGLPRPSEAWSPRKAPRNAVSLSPQRERERERDFSTHNVNHALHCFRQVAPAAPNDHASAPSLPSGFTGAFRLPLPALHRPIPVHGSWVGRAPAPAATATVTTMTDTAQHNGMHASPLPSVNRGVGPGPNGDDSHGDGYGYADSDEDAYGEQDTDADAAPGLASGLVAPHPDSSSCGSPRGPGRMQGQGQQAPAQMSPSALYTDVEVDITPGAARHGIVRRGTR